MPSASDRSPPGRRMFSRFTSPFASSSRNVAEFSIHSDDEHKKYSPGDVVTGHVKLRVAKPVRITHMVVCLHGFVQVFKTPGSPGESFRANSAYLGTGRGKKSGEYFGNGFASLFEDEVVLCGDGRLGEGEYQFEFELEFPQRNLPSSIDFERGTISYMITATLTRPHAISPTMSCDRKVYLVEHIDISSLHPPKARTLTLEPAAKRSRAKNSTRKLGALSDKSRKSTSVQQESNTSRRSVTSSSPSVQLDGQTPGSPIPSESEISFGSRRSSNQRTSQPDSQSGDSPTSTSTPTPSDAARCSTSKLSLADKNINVTIEPLAGGCLKGNSIPVKINVSHRKPVKSVYGVILTLFRQARVDMRPSIPLGPIEKGKEGKYEDYYPRSYTGLGGLSLSGAGSNHVFRKDLYQSMSPLFIDPQTFTAEIHAKVRVPDEAFPTIATVPGSMISFKYYVEVVVDIQGKLQGLEKSANNLAGQAAPVGHVLNYEVSDMERSAFTPFGSTVIDTSSVRRDKGVVTFTFEVVIGTTGIDPRKGKQKMETMPEIDGAHQHPLPQPQSPNLHSEAHSSFVQDGADGYYDYHDYQWYGEHPYGYDSADPYYPMYYEHTYHQPLPSSIPVPMPHIPDEGQMTEKERIQQAETRLLPSQPPGLGEGHEDSTVGATAPFLPDEHTNDVLQVSMPALPEYRTVASSSGAQTLNMVEDEENQSLQTGIPADVACPTDDASTHAVPVGADDKQEMRRQQQLQAEASVPPKDEPDDTEPASPMTAPEPSAPTMNEVDQLPQDIYDSHAEAADTPGLPRYER